jgi:hypothetical protein
MPRIGKSIIDNFIFLKKLTKTKSDQKRRRLLRLATDSELLSIIESAYNILKGRFQLTTRQRHRILPYIEVIRNIGRVRSSRGAKRVIQRGAGLAVLPAILTPILIEAFRFIKNNGQ